MFNIFKNTEYHYFLAFFFLLVDFSGLLLMVLLLVNLMCVWTVVMTSTLILFASSSVQRPRCLRYSFLSYPKTFLRSCLSAWNIWLGLEVTGVAGLSSPCDFPV